MVEENVPPDRPAWAAQGFLTNRIPAVRESRKKDFCFSTWREIPGSFMEEKREWVYAFLEQHGCFDEFDGDANKVIKGMKISSNVRNEQVTIECHEESMVQIFSRLFKKNSCSLFNAATRVDT